MGQIEFTALKEILHGVKERVVRKVESDTKLFMVCSFTLDEAERLKEIEFVDLILTQEQKLEIKNLVFFIYKFAIGIIRSRLYDKLKEEKRDAWFFHQLLKCKREFFHCLDAILRKILYCFAPPQPVKDFDTLISFFRLNDNEWTDKESFKSDVYWNLEVLDRSLERFDVVLTEGSTMCIHCGTLS